MSSGRIGVYIDGYNLYYGAREQCANGADSWKWIDVRALVERVAAEQLRFARSKNYGGNVAAWDAATIDRVVYCTARIDAKQNPIGHVEQDTYLKALLASGSVDWIEYGYYVTRAKKAPLALETSDPKRPQIARSQWPVMVQDSQRRPVRNAAFIVSYLHTEEKGSDVNVATHLLADVMSGACDAAIVVSNDSDLRLPIEMARKRVPVGVISPRSGPAHGALRHKETMVSTKHWNRNIRASDVLASQLPATIGALSRPAAW